MCYHKSILHVTRRKNKKQKYNFLKYNLGSRDESGKEKNGIKTLVFEFWSKTSRGQHFVFLAILNISERITARNMSSICYKHIQLQNKCIIYDSQRIVWKKTTYWLDRQKSTPPPYFWDTFVLTKRHIKRSSSENLYILLFIILA